MPLRAAPHVLAAMSVDYLADPRMGDVPFMKLKRFIIDAGVDKKEASNSATKFALVALAEKNDVKLDALLDQYGEAPGAATPAPEPAAPPAAAEPPPSAPEPTPAPEPEPEPAPPPAAETAPPPAAEEPPAKAKVEKLAVPKPEAAPLAKKPPSPRGRRVSRGAASPRGSPSPRGASPRSASKRRESGAGGDKSASTMKPKATPIKAAALEQLDAAAPAPMIVERKQSIAERKASLLAAQGAAAAPGAAGETAEPVLGGIAARKASLRKASMGADAAPIVLDAAPAAAVEPTPEAPAEPAAQPAPSEEVPPSADPPAVANGVAKLLIEAGANPKQQTLSGETASSLAKKAGKRPMTTSWWRLVEA